MSTQSTSNFALKAFYVDTAIENWTCARIMECYRSKSEQKDRKKVLDRIKKDLEEVEESDSFDTRKKRKAREILDNWKNWTDTQKIMKRSSDVNIGRLQVKKMKNFASGSATQVVDNNTVYRMENVVKMLMSPMMTSCPLVNQSGKIYHYQRLEYDNKIF
ncbi:hypothetical protein RhiirC2_200303 [Rhizophagus irregularis]|uniref:Uncharacterized protein n=1 Tax=Rhizophagus irregularis TaxID=588596 RepID=A0A2N1MJK0_9GLOM|nr:hypothetical protein RhiirC2_200303 [Rhizophagus irregularis]